MSTRSTIFLNDNVHIYHDWNTNRIEISNGHETTVIAPIDEWINAGMPSSTNQVDELRQLRIKVSQLEDALLQKAHNEIVVMDSTEAQQKIEELKEEIAVTDKLLENRSRVLSLIPECPDHGFCLPHFEDWIKEKLTNEANNAHHQSDNNGRSQRS